MSTRAEQPRRMFRVSDAMILVAATAPALAVQRGLPFECFHKTFAYSDYFTCLHEDLYVVSYLFGSLTLACLLLRLRRPRPSVRRLTREPGMVACATATTVLAFNLLNLVCMGGLIRIDSKTAFAHFLKEPGYYFEFPLIPSIVGCAVAAVWTVQALSGRWRPVASWIDRMGRILGLFWVGTIPFAWFDVWIEGP